jgi:uncharacterized protein (DUF433 family)
VAPHLAGRRPLQRNKRLRPEILTRSRVETRALAALARRGMGASNIIQLYPSLDEKAVIDAIDLEEQLERNLHPRVAA